MKKPSALGALLLTLGALIWGTAFVAQSMGMDHVGPCAFNGARSFIGSLALLPVIFFRDKLRPSLAPQAQEEVYSWKNPALLRGGASRRQACCSRPGCNIPPLERLGSSPPCIL